jgi:hypothetical protein
MQAFGSQQVAHSAYFNGYPWDYNTLLNSWTACSSIYYGPISQHLGMREPKPYHEGLGKGIYYSLCDGGKAVVENPGPPPAQA